MTSLPSPHAPTRDRGAAMIITMMVVALVTVLGTTVLRVTVSNLGSTVRAENSAMALDAADAGLSQATARLRAEGGLDVVSPTSGGIPCTQDGWRGRSAMFTGAVSGAVTQSYRVWMARCPSSSSRVRVFKVTAEGTARTGKRVVQQDVVLSLEGVDLPLGVFARSIQGGGAAAFKDISLFSTGCVWKRSQLDVSGYDAAYDKPAAVHSSKIITDSQGNTVNCSEDNKAIHRGGGAANDCPKKLGNGPKAVSVEYDQDSLGGGPCPGSDMASKYPQYYAPQDLDGDGGNDVNYTYIKDDAALAALYGASEQPIPPSKLEELKAIARTQGNYYQSTSYTVPDPAVENHGVLYFDLKGTSVGGTVNLNPIASRWAKLPDSGPCPQRSLIVIIDNGNATMNSNSATSASVILTSKTWGDLDKGNGTSQLTGTVYANTVNVSGTLDVSLNDCFLTNISPSLFSAESRNYLELDRS